jgi:hypothetical protein
MEELTFDDIQRPNLDLKSVEFLGKRAYLKSLSFADQQKVEAKGEELEGDQLLNLLALTLCNKEGKLFFDDIDQAREVLKGHSAEDIFAVFASIKSENGLDHEAEVKN